MSEEKNEMPQAAELKLCPFCGGTDAEPEVDQLQGTKWGHVVCRSCGACGEEVRTDYDQSPDAPWRAEAIAAWNRRVGRDSEALSELRRLYRAYVSLLEIGRDRLMDHGIACDPVDVMEAGDPALVSARATIEAARRIVAAVEKAAKSRAKWEHAGRHVYEGDPDTVARALLAASPMESAPRDALKEIERLRAALTKIAAYDDDGGNTYLAARGSYGRFDEPVSVEIAREALKETP